MKQSLGLLICIGIPALVVTSPVFAAENLMLFSPEGLRAVGPPFKESEAHWIGVYGTLTAAARLPDGDFVVGNSEGVIYRVDRNDLTNALGRKELAKGTPITTLATQSNGNIVAAAASEGSGAIWVIEPCGAEDIGPVVASATDLPAHEIAVQADNSLIISHQEKGYLYARDERLGPHPSAPGFREICDNGPLALAVRRDGGVIVAGGPASAGYLWRLGPDLSSMAFVNIEGIAPFKKVMALADDSILAASSDTGYLYLRDKDNLGHRAFREVPKNISALAPCGKDSIAVICDIASQANSDRGYLYLLGANDLEPTGFHTHMGPEIFATLPVK